MNMFVLAKFFLLMFEEKNLLYNYVKNSFDLNSLFLDGCWGWI